MSSSNNFQKLRAGGRGLNIKMQTAGILHRCAYSQIYVPDSEILDSTLENVSQNSQLVPGD